MSKIKFIGYTLHLILPLLVISEICLHQIEKNQIAMALTNLDAQASIQKARIQDMIVAYYQRILNITNREVLKKCLIDFWEYGDVDQLVLMKKFLPNVKQPYSDFKEIFIFDREGSAVTSTQSAMRYEIPIDPHVLSEGRKRLTVTSFESESETQSKSVELLLMGPILSKGVPIGGVGIVTDNATLASIAGDLSGLGQTGEIYIAKKNERGDAEIIMRGARFSDHPQAMANIPQHELDNPMTQALFRYEGILRNTVDGRGRPVFAATRFIQEEDWGVVVKIDKQEILEPVVKLRRLAYGLLGMVFVFWLIMGPIWFKPSQPTNEADL